MLIISIYMNIYIINNVVKLHKKRKKLKTKKLQANIEEELLTRLNKLRKDKKIDRDTLLSVIIYEGMESIKDLEKKEIIKKYIAIIEKLENN